MLVTPFHDLSSAKLFLKEIESFGKCSGLVLNKDKSEAMWIGSSAHNPSKPLGISLPDDPIRGLGISPIMKMMQQGKLGEPDQ
jgi:hypothetical protein